ncbi:MAG: glycosyltransferase, partial [candidate division NC10 bacterium]
MRFRNYHIMYRMMTGYHAAALVIGVVQLACAARFASFFRRRRHGGPYPQASVVVPCKGEDEGLEANVEALLRQDYDGKLEFLFVVPSEHDPAFARLKVLAGEPARFRLLVSGAAPRNCSEKILNLLHGAENAQEDSELLLFADSDNRVAEDWAAELAAPFQDEA